MFASARGSSAASLVRLHHCSPLQCSAVGLLVRGHDGIRSKTGGTREAGRTDDRPRHLLCAVHASNGCIPFPVLAPFCRIRGGGGYADALLQSALPEDTPMLLSNQKAPSPNSAGLIGLNFCDVGGCHSCHSVIPCTRKVAVAMPAHYGLPFIMLLAVARHVVFSPLAFGWLSRQPRAAN